MKIDLVTGLWLEDRSALITWGSTFDDLRAVAPPDFWTMPKESPPIYQLAWNSRVWGGLGAQVRTFFGGEVQPQAVLRKVWLAFQVPTSIRSCAAGFQWLQGELQERFGSPDSFRDDGESGEAHWQIGEVAILHEYFDGMGGGHFVFLSAAKT